MISSDLASIILTMLPSTFGEIDYIEKDQSIPAEVRQSKNFRLRAYYFAGGLETLYQEWFNGNLDCTLFDIPLEVSKMFSPESQTPIINRNFQ